MSKNPAPTERLDERLGVLLDVEQRLAKRVADAEVEALRRVADARADGERVAEQARRREAEQGAALEREVRAAHEQALVALKLEHDAELAKLAAVSPETIERLAHRALARAMGDEEGAS